MYKKVFLVVAWAIATLLLVNLSFTLINLPSTLLNIGGVFLLVGTVIMGSATKCFTKNIFKKK